MGGGATNEYPTPQGDIIVTLGCGDACSVLPGRRYYDWHLPDLKGLDIESARFVRDCLGTRIADLTTTITSHAVL